MSSATNGRPLRPSPSWSPGGRTGRNDRRRRAGIPLHTGAIVVACKRFVQFRSALSGQDREMTLSASGRQAALAAADVATGDVHALLTLAARQDGTPPTPSSAPAGNRPDDPFRAEPPAFTRGASARRAPACRSGRTAAGSPAVCLRTGSSFGDRTASTAGRFTRYRPRGQPGSNPGARPRVRIGACRCRLRRTRARNGRRPPRRNQPYGRRTHHGPTQARDQRQRR